MIERPNRGEPKGFGKRGSVTMNRAVAAAAVPEKADAGTGGMQMPKWVIGGVAAAFLLMMVTMSGGIGGGGFLGGLLGGLLANKMMNSGKTPTATAAAPRDAGVSQMRPTSASPDSLSRGGFGTTASSPSHSSGGSSFGG